MEADPLLKDLNSSDLEVAGEFLTIWLPFLTRDLCQCCSAALIDRVRLLHPGRDPYRAEPQGEVIDRGGEVINGSPETSDIGGSPETSVVSGSVEEYNRGSKDGAEHFESTDSDIDQEEESPAARISWADMAQQEGSDQGEESTSRKSSLNYVMAEGNMILKKTLLSRDQREQIRFSIVRRKKDFVYLERLNGRTVNILDGLELHTDVFSAAEQKRIVDFVYELQERGKNNEFGEHTYSAPRKWMRGKGRVTIQFGCCYNYAERNGTPPGILHSVMADPIPSLFKVMIKRLVGWHVMPTDCVPDSCIVNIYEASDCIPPHIDSHDFVRPFCTVSFLSECDILFGPNLKITGPGEFSGSTSISLPVGSVLVLKGNGADVAKHCVPAVPSKRISITFRKMDESKWPRGFRLEPDLQNIKPYDLGAGNGSGIVIEDEPASKISAMRGARSNGSHEDETATKTSTIPGAGRSNGSQHSRRHRRESGETDHSYRSYGYGEPGEIPSRRSHRSYRSYGSGGEPKEIPSRRSHRSYRSYGSGGEPKETPSHHGSVNRRRSMQVT
ncbi:hypothetical protein KSP39_PZI009547 [Platanthera zijinensis]|uniref:Fe2OG dioxygenase domain-containing protein n=1 Tax=Platanthera zijinensis TaxID=2320716 RepID=A0AAP0BLC7_9ASPA